MRVFPSFALAAFVVAASGFAAQAACENGYETLGNGVTRYCEGGPTSAVVMEPDIDVSGTMDEPLTTGSIGPAPDSDAVEAVDPALESAPAPTGAIANSANPDLIRPDLIRPDLIRQAESRADCQPGQYYMMELDDASTPMMCH